MHGKAFGEAFTHWRFIVILTETAPLVVALVAVVMECGIDVAALTAHPILHADLCAGQVVCCSVQLLLKK